MNLALWPNFYPSIMLCIIFLILLYWYVFVRCSAVKGIGWMGKKRKTARNQVLMMPAQALVTKGSKYMNESVSILIFFASCCRHLNYRLLLFWICSFSPMEFLQAANWHIIIMEVALLVYIRQIAVLLFWLQGNTKLWIPERENHIYSQWQVQTRGNTG